MPLMASSVDQIRLDTTKERVSKFEDNVNRNFLDHNAKKKRKTK